MVCHFALLNCTMRPLGWILELEGKTSGNCAGALELFVSYLHRVASLMHWVAGG